MPKPKQFMLPATAQGFFDACQIGDGALGVSVANQGETVGRAAFEWATQGENGWALEAYNPLGQTMLRLGYEKPKHLLSKSGPMAAELPEIDIDDDGFLEVDGYFVPLRPREIPCILKFKWPQDWLSHAYDYKRETNRIELKIAEDKRSIDLELTGISSLVDKRTCALIKWTHFWGMASSQVRLCQTLGEKSQAVLEGLKGFEIRWRDQNG